ncbi:MAG: POTRA domain-containing protein, partial [Candidatus Sumerlaeota bacterium]
MHNHRAFITRLIFLTALTLSLALSVSQAQDETAAIEPPSVIREITFEGIETLTREELMAKIQTEPGMLLDRERLREDLKRLAPLAWNWPEVRAEQVDGGIRLVFRLMENPRLDSIHIIGNVRISGEDLRKAVRVKPGDILTRNAVEKARESIAREYRGRGYLRADISAELVVSGTPEKPIHILQVMVDEGRKVRVDDLLIEGNKAFSDTRLKMLIETAGSWMFMRNYFDPAIFEDDLRNLRTFYQSKGYFDATVQPGRFEEDSREGTITPKIVINEGPRYTLEDIRVVGNGEIFSTEEIIGEFSHLEGKPFEAGNFDKAVGRVRNMYANAGFVTTEIREDFTFTDAGAIVATLNIDEKAKVKVGRVLVRRASWELEEDATWFAQTYYRLAPPVEDDVIMDNITLESGEVYEKR